MTLSTHVIILAQGNQRRLNTKPPKCLFPLEGCGGRPIIYRTLVQIWRALGGVGCSEAGGYNDHRVTVVSWYEVKQWFDINPVFLPRRGAVPWDFMPEVISLPDPGNSSLKGISRYLAFEESRYNMSDHNRVRIAPPERTVVLLGDVVYSWRVIDALFTIESNMMFAGTHDLSPGGGELWGIEWDRSVDRLMRDCLYRAIVKHPKFEDYQPGQLRNWLWEVDKTLSALVSGGNRDWYHPTYSEYDYTMDVDLPEHIPLLGPASRLAADDDREHGVVW